MDGISLIIPVLPEENSWHGLVDDLRILPDGTEVIVVGPSAPSGLMPKLKKAYQDRFRIIFAESKLGRAPQLNYGAKQASGPYLWFLHADTRINRKTLKGLRATLAEAPEALVYFDLNFLPDGPLLMGLNKYGTLFRSRIFKLPFGDQAFAMSRSTYENIGGFCEESQDPEDHLFVIKARRLGVPILSAGGKVYTSARKYDQHGWLRTTGRHLRMTAAVSFKHQWQQLRDKP